MANVKVKTTSQPKRRIKPATNPEAEENQCIALAFDLVKQRLMDGTASSQETTHFLKLASSKTKLELENLREQNKLITAKTKAIESSDHSEELYKNAIEAMMRYTGHGGEEDEY